MYIFTQFFLSRVPYFSWARWYSNRVVDASSVVLSTANATDKQGFNVEGHARTNVTDGHGLM